jgi:hypothetical protein
MKQLLNTFNPLKSMIILMVILFTSFNIYAQCHGGSGGSPTSSHGDHQQSSSNNSRKTESTFYTCPMHSDVRSINPGNCTKCGMALEMKTVKESTQKKNKFYVCRDHDSIKSSTKGKCKICGKKLKKEVEYTYY